MKFGLAATTSVNPAVTETAQADYVVRIAEAAEALAFDSLWVSDRTVYPADLAARYPDRFGPGQADPAGQNVLEAITTLSYLAGLAPSVRLGISVLVLPFRDPVLNAKMISTLDVLSGGRVICGVGSGWMPGEFKAMAASYADRGQVTDQHLGMFKTLCLQNLPEGERLDPRITGMTFFPKPIQQPHPPIWVGGNSRAALKRAARFGDAWHGIGLTPSEVARKGRTLGRLCADCDRTADEVALTMRATLRLGESQRTPAGERVPLSGSPAQILDDVRRLHEAGLTYLVLSVAGQTTKATIENIHTVATEIMSQAQACN